jgi:hypothetical protein
MTSSSDVQAKASDMIAAATILHEIADFLTQCALDEQLLAKALASAEWEALKASTPKPKRKRVVRKIAE